MAQGVLIALSQARALQREVAIAEFQWRLLGQTLPQDEGEEDATESDESDKEVDDMEGDEEEATEKTESKKKRHKSEDENKKDNAAGGDWELPSMFRAFRGSDRGWHEDMQGWIIRD